MKNIVKTLMALFVVSFLVTSCGSKPTNQSAGTAKDGNEQKIEEASMKLVKAVDEGGYNLVSTQDLKGWIDDGKDMLIVDTMPKDSYEKNRIPGAVNAELPVKMEDVTDEQKEAFIKALGEDKSKPVVLYCGFVGCERSHVAALIAKEQGFTEIYRQPGGIVAWMNAGYDVESGK